MTTTTIFANTNDGLIQAQGINDTWANMRAGTPNSSFSANTGSSVPGAYAVYVTDKAGLVHQVDEYFVEFDTSPLGDLDTINSVAFSLYGQSLAAQTSDTGQATIYAQAKNWGPTVTTADWVTGTTLAGGTKLASFDLASWATSAYNTFTEAGTAFRAAINKAGNTGLVVYPKRLESASSPTIDTGTNAGFIGVAHTGTSQDPKMVVDSSPPGSASTGFLGLIL